MQTFEMLDSVD